MDQHRFDIVVIGAGIAGASVAAELAAKAKVAVLEAESQPGYHSTGRSAALFTEIYGPEPIRALTRASRAFLYQPPEGFAEAPLVRRRGALRIGCAEQKAAVEALAARADVAAASHMIAPARAFELCPILKPEAVAAAVLEPDAADIDVNALHHGFLRLLRRRGGALMTGRRVERLWRGDGLWIAEAGGERFAAPVVVNAAGAWAEAVGELSGLAPIGLTPTRRTAVLVEPPAGLDPGPWPAVIDIDEGFYFKPDAGLLLLSSADETPSEPCDAQADEWDVAVAVDRVERATSLKVRTVRHRWAGLRSFVADRAPAAGYDRVAPGFFWLAGQGGYGIQTAPALARTAAALVLGEPLAGDLLAAGVEPARFSPSRLSPAGFLNDRQEATA